MNKFFIVLLFFLVSGCIPVFSQDQNPVAKSGNEAIKYSATTKHMWEIGVNGGLDFLSGDIDGSPGLGGGLHIRRAIDNIFSIRLEGQFRNLKGFEKNGSRNPDAVNSQILSDLGYGDGVGKSDWYPNYSTNMISGSAQLIMSLNQFRFIKPNRTLNPYLFLGAGASIYDVKVDAKDALGNIYNFSSQPSKNDLDGTYETELELVSDDLNKNNLSPMAEVGVGIAIKITPRFNIGIEQKASFLFGRGSDYLDGALYRTNGDQTVNRDILSSTFIRLNFNIGNKEKMSEPLWWINPLDFVLNDIAELKARPKLDLTDTDGDGVLDMFDQEKESPAGTPVDVRGITLDSDSDGVPNYKDKEPYSAPNYPVNVEGVAQVPKNSVSPNEVNQIIEDKLREFRLTKGGGLTDWFLPTIHFDLDKYSVKNSEVEKLRQVAIVIQNNPSIKILVTGHTDKTAGDAYNKVLSYNRAKAAIEYLVNKFNVSRERLVLTYGGEEQNLINSDSANYMNRRVEFQVAKPTDSEMPRPAGPKAGSGKFEGSRDAGY